MLLRTTAQRKHEVSSKLVIIIKWSQLIHIMFITNYILRNICQDNIIYFLMTTYPCFSHFEKFVIRALALWRADAARPLKKQQFVVHATNLRGHLLSLPTLQFYCQT